MYLSFQILTKGKKIKISAEEKQKHDLKILKGNNYITN